MIHLIVFIVYLSLLYFTIGYDNPFLVLPDEIKTLLKNAVESQEWIDAGCNGLGNSLNDELIEAR